MNLYSLFLLFAALLLCSADMNSNTQRLLAILLIVAALSAVFDYLRAHASFRAWLHRFF